MELSIKKINKLRDPLLIFVIVFVAAFIRRTDAFTNPQPWAEDCSIYLMQYEHYGIYSLLMPYGGYLHFIPRLIVLFWGALHVNYLYIPICYNFSAFIITLGVVLNIWKTSSYLNIKHKILYATSFLFLPIGSEVFMNLANINWIASLYLINFLFVRSTDYSSKNEYIVFIIIFLISLSGPFSTLLSPLVLLSILLERKEMSFRKLIPLCLILLGGIVQFICIEFIHTDFYRGMHSQPEHYHLVKLLTNNTGTILLIYHYFNNLISPFILTLLSLLLFLLLLFVFIIRYFKIDNKRRYILLGYAIILLLAFIQAYWPNESQIWAASSETARYYFIPFTCIGWLMILSFDKKIRPIYLVPYFALFLLQWPYIRMVLPDKQWKKEITEYYEGKRLKIDINPDNTWFPSQQK